MSLLAFSVVVLLVAFVLLPWSVWDSPDKTSPWQEFFSWLWPYSISTLYPERSGQA